MDELTELEKAYIAGIIDGEGSITIANNKERYKDKVYRSYRLVVQVGNNDIGLIDWLHSLGGCVTRRPLPSGKVFYNWIVESRIAGFLLGQLLPYLRIRKRQAEAAILFQSKRRHNGRAGKPSEDKAFDETLREIVSPNVDSIWGGK